MFCVVNVGLPCLYVSVRCTDFERIVKKRLEAGKMEGLNVVVDCTYVYSKSRIHPRIGSIRAANCIAPIYPRADNCSHLEPGGHLCTYDIRVCLRLKRRKTEINTAQFMAFVNSNVPAARQAHSFLR